MSFKPEISLFLSVLFLKGRYKHMQWLVKTAVKRDIQSWDSEFFFLKDFIFFLRFYLFIFREKGREGEGKGEKHQCVVASHASPTGDLACNADMCPHWESNWQPFGLQAHGQSTELHQPEQILNS